MVVLVLLNLGTDRRGRVLGLADRPGVLVLRLEALEQVALLGLHLGADLLGYLGGNDSLVLLPLVDRVRDRLDAVLVVVLQGGKEGKQVSIWPAPGHKARQRRTYDVTLTVDGLGRLDVLVADDGLLGNRGSRLGADLGRLGLVALVKEVLRGGRWDISRVSTRAGRHHRHR